MTSLPPGATIGILGGGQLGRMLAMAAARLGLRTHVLDPGADGPAAQVATASTQAAWEDAEAVRRFAEGCDVVTYEWENVPSVALDAVEAVRPLRPPRRAIDVSADRLTEKRFLRELGLSTAPFEPVENAGSLVAALEAIATPAILKTRRLGYDGRGQVRLDTPEDAAGALESMKGAPAILEGFVDFDAELSVVAARGRDGETAAFEPGLNVHEDGILRTTTVPSGLPATIRQDAVLQTARILSALDYVGVIGVEFFVVGRGLMVNEFAPRVHNSGHWTQGACAVDQFEQHVRAVAGWPLGDGMRHADCTMRNLIGADVQHASQIAREPGAQLHLYGKGEWREGRKMGHVNHLRAMAR